MDSFIDVPERLALKGVSRRDFMKFCGMMATVLGLPCHLRQGSPMPLQNGRRSFGCTLRNAPDARNLLSGARILGRQTLFWTP